MFEEFQFPDFLETPSLDSQCSFLDLEEDYPKQRNLITEKISQRINNFSPITTLITDPTKSKGIPRKVVLEALKEWNPFFKFETAFEKIKGKKINEIDPEDEDQITLFKKTHFFMICFKLDNGFLKIMDNTIIRSEPRSFLFPSEKQVLIKDIKEWFLDFKISFYTVLQSFINNIDFIPQWNSFKIDIYDELSFFAY